MNTEADTCRRYVDKKLYTLQSKVDSLRRLQSETAAGLDAMLPGVLDRAFRGEL
ncbi:MAG: hypothetical protein HY558_04640 [Euryarchaeota archaeon]|nr:hypothetical protein [Euryarchaeota archaeon]